MYIPSSKIYLIYSIKNLLFQRPSSKLSILNPHNIDKYVEGKKSLNILLP